MADVGRAEVVLGRGLDWILKGIAVPAETHFFVYQNRALAIHDVPGSYEHETLRWRRGRALLELGRYDAAGVDLERACAALDTHPSQGPREVLGCLAALALLVHRDDPDQAERLLHMITERRGGWILPHYADRDIVTVGAALTCST